jgi:hypothetical protein
MAVVEEREKGVNDLLMNVRDDASNKGRAREDVPEEDDGERC